MYSLGYMITLKNLLKNCISFKKFGYFFFYLLWGFGKDSSIGICSLSVLNDQTFVLVCRIQVHEKNKLLTLKGQEGVEGIMAHQIFKNLYFKKSSPSPTLKILDFS